LISDKIPRYIKYSKNANFPRKRWVPEALPKAVRKLIKKLVIWFLITCWAAHYQKKKKNQVISYVFIWTNSLAYDLDYIT